MEITIKGNPKEIAALVLAIQERLGNRLNHEYIGRDDDGEPIMNPYNG